MFLPPVSLVSADWRMAPTFESCSNGQEGIPSLHLAEPFEKVCQSSDWEDIQTYGYKNGHAFLHSGNISEEADLEVSLKYTERNRAFLSPSIAAMKQKTFNTKDPLSPDVTCLGRVRIRESHNPNKDLENLEIHTKDGNVADRYINVSDEIQAMHKLRSRNVVPVGKTGCLMRMKHRETGSTIAVSETTATRRERAAALARSLTSLLADLRKLEMEDQSYEPAVPPPNSLLLMRCPTSADKSGRKIAMLSELYVSPSDENNIESSYLKGELSYASIIHFDQGNVQREHMQPQAVVPLSEVSCNSLHQSNALSKPRSERHVDICYACPPKEQLALWQRRAIRKLDAIDVKFQAKLVRKGPAIK